MTPDAVFILTESIVKMATAQVNHISAQCVLGYAPQKALEGRSVEELRRMGVSTKRREVKLTSAVVHDLKHDVKFLEQQEDMRAFVSKSQKGNAKAFAHSTQERKQVRRALRRLTKVSMTHCHFGRVHKRQ